MSGAVQSCQHATTEGHSEDSHPDAWGLPPAHTTGPGKTQAHTQFQINAGKKVDELDNSLIMSGVCLFSGFSQLWLQ